MIKWLVKLEKLKLNKYEDIYKVLNIEVTDLAEKITLEDISTDIKNLNRFLEITENVGDRILLAMKSNEGVLIHIDPNTSSTLKIQKEDLYINLDETSIEKFITRSNATKKLEEGFAVKYSVVNLYKYLGLLCKFAEHGIFINDANKEEKYIEIINAENPELIDYLQEYLDLKEVVDLAMLGMYEYIKDAQ